MWIWYVYLNLSFRNILINVKQKTMLFKNLIYPQKYIATNRHKLNYQKYQKPSTKSAAIKREPQIPLCELLIPLCEIMSTWLSARTVCSHTPWRPAVTVEIRNFFSNKELWRCKDLPSIPTVTVRIKNFSSTIRTVTGWWDGDGAAYHWADFIPMNRLHSNQTACGQTLPTHQTKASKCWGSWSHYVLYIYW
jgi:hypothetical protein